MVFKFLSFVFFVNKSQLFIFKKCQIIDPNAHLACAGINTGQPTFIVSYHCELIRKKRSH